MRLRLACAATVLGLALLGAPASAIFVETPLHLAGDKSEANVGDAVRFTVSPANESMQAAWKDHAVRVAWEEVDMGEGPPSQGGIRQLQLDGKASGTFDWTLPAEVDDKNVFVVLWSPEGERLGQFHVRVGDAEPIAFTLGSPGEGAPEQGEPVPFDGDGQRDAPGPAVLIVLAALGAVALAAARRRA